MNPGEDAQEVRDVQDVQEPTDEEVEALRLKLDREARAGGYNLNPDVDFTRGLCRGLIINQRRYGYMSCPCRLASGDAQEDIDIVCPCYYRDPDVVEHGACYCALYVSKDVLEGKRELGPVPERRPPLEERMRQKPRIVAAAGSIPGQGLTLSAPVWRCLVCGYLCARDGPPEVCPICKASKERFERFL